MSTEPPIAAATSLLSAGEQLPSEMHFIAHLLIGPDRPSLLVIHNLE